MILRFNRVSENQTVMTPRTWYLNSFINESYNTTVNVPAVFTNGLFTFSFEEELKRNGLLRDKSADTISGILSVVAQIDEALSDEKLRRLLVDSQISLYITKEPNPKDKDGKKAKLTEDDITAKELEDLRMLKQEMSKRFVLSGISNAVLTDVLTTSATKMSFGDFAKLSLKEVSSSLSIIQQYYAKYCMSDSVEALVSFASDKIFQDRAIGFVTKVVDNIMVAEGASMQARMSYVQNTIFEALYGKEYIAMEPVIDALEYKVDNMDQVPDLGYVEALWGYVATLRVIMGGDVLGTSATGLSMRDIIDSQIMHSADFLPFIPNDLGRVDEDKMNALIGKRWVYHVIRRVTSNDFGTLLQRINSITDLRKYRRNDSLDNALQKANMAVSICFDAFMDVGAEFRALIDDQNIYFADLPLLKREKFSEFFFSFLNSYNSYKTPLDHPRFLYEPANLVNHHLAVYSGGTNIDFAVTDEDSNDVKSQVTNDQTFDINQYMRTNVKSGAPIESKSKISNRLIMFAQLYNPIYIARIKKSTVLSTDLFSTVGRIIPLSKLKKSSRIANHLLQEGNIYAFFSAESMASELRIPLAVAKYIYVKTDSAYVVFPKMGDLYLTWDSDLAPLLEINITEKVNHVPPFVAKWPFFIMRTIHSGIQWATTPLKVGDKRVEQPEMKVIPPKELDPKAPITTPTDKPKDDV